MRKVAEVARRVREHTKKVPKGHDGHTLSLLYAAIQEGLEWPIKADHRALLTKIMDTHERKGGEVDWWREECASPTVTR